MAYILQGVVGRYRQIGDDAKKAALKAAKEAAIAKGAQPGGPPGGGMTVGDDDGKIFGLPPVVVAAGAAILGYIGIRAIQRRQGKRAA